MALKKPSKKELEHLASKVDNEGFGYYMLDYGPDLDLLERMGFNKDETKKAIQVLSKIQDSIMQIGWEE